jgi:hypothetical protein
MTTRTSSRQSSIDNNKVLANKFIERSNEQIKKINHYNTSKPDKIKYFTKLFHLAFDFFHVVEKEVNKNHERMSNVYYQKATELCSEQMVIESIQTPNTRALVKITTKYQRLVERHLKQKYETELLDRHFGRDVANIILQFAGVQFDSTITLFTRA